MGIQEISDLPVVSLDHFGKYGSHLIANRTETAVLIFNGQTYQQAKQIVIAKGAVVKELKNKKGNKQQLNQLSNRLKVINESLKKEKDPKAVQKLIDERKDIEGQISAFGQNIGNQADRNHTVESLRADKDFGNIAVQYWTPLVSMYNPASNLLNIVAQFDATQPKEIRHEAATTFAGTGIFGATHNAAFEQQLLKGVQTASETHHATAA